jgi:hypothetical protein
MRLPHPRITRGPAVAALLLVTLCGALLPTGGCKKATDNAGTKKDNATDPPPAATPEKVGQPDRAIRPPYASNFEAATCDAISGWVWDSTQPNVPLKIDVYDGDYLIGTYVADGSRQDLLRAGIGDGKHGFRIPTPARLKDGQPHTVRVVLSGTATQLGNSPRTVQCP